MSKKTGIITVHKNVNYGANLQAFASSRYLCKQGYDCRVIDYTLPEHEKSNHLLSWLKQSWDGEKNKSLSRKLKLAAALLLSMPRKHRRLKAFAKFRKTHIGLTPVCKSIGDVERLCLDTVICGSDQIWNPTITGGIKPIFFSSVNGVKTRISYAASMGRDKFDDADEEKVKQLVSALDYCSVREENTAEYISSLTGRKVETVCDPVFLLDRADYEAVSAKRLFKKDYILLYSVVHNDALSAIAKAYADRHGLKLIEICAAKDKNATHKQITTFGPSEFLSAFQHAKTVFTNSFHGTAFSLIFEKDFYIVDNKEGGSRITNLLSKVGLGRRLVSSTVDEDFEAIDYEKSNALLGEYVSSSKRFLENAMKSDKVAVTEKGCLGCGACAAICKFDAIRLVKSEEGFLSTLIDQNKCVDCKMCKRVCPTLNEPAKHEPPQDVYAFKAEDALREESTSGGAFAALAEAVIKEGGVFYGAAQGEDFSVSHIRGETMLDLQKMQGTKYLPSDMTACYARIEADLLAGRKVLFSGTPCQVDGVKRFITAKRLPEENIYFVDIICHGVPSPAFYEAYMRWLEKEYGSKVVEYKFRSKKLSWRGSSCYARLSNGMEFKNEKKLCAFMNTYYSDHITRESCYTCPYTSKDRVSDLTISDYWGLENLDKSFEDALGVSMLLVNTDKGRTLLEKMKGEKIVGSLEIAKQPQLTHPTARPATRDEFWLVYRQKGIKPLLKKYGGMKCDSLKTILYKIKKKIFK